MRTPHIFHLAPLALLLLACGDDQQPDEALALWNRIHDEGYTSFERAPGYETRQPSDAPHSDHVDIYINDVVGEALALGEPLDSWPLGSLIVKDGFDDEGQLDLVAVMDKREGGWFWAEYTDPSAGGDAKFSGEPGVCTGCHQSGADFVRAFPLPQ